MKSIKLILMAILTVTGLCGCTSKSANNAASSQDTQDTRMLVCYFSATGTTADAAKRIADISGADLYQITPRESYTDADLDWRDSLSRSSIEMRDLSSRPEIVDSLPDLTKYDIIFIGYPNWWNTHPTIINTFIEANDFQGKTVVPFMTSGGSDIINSEQQLHQTYPSLNLKNGLLMNSVSDDDIRQWINNANI